MPTLMFDAGPAQFPIPLPMNVVVTPFNGATPADWGADPVAPVVQSIPQVLNEVANDDDKNLEIDAPATVNETTEPIWESPVRILARGDSENDPNKSA